MTILAEGLKDVQNEPHDMDASTVFNLVLPIIFLPSGQC